MKRIVTYLKDDHKLIADKIGSLKSLIHEDFSESCSKIIDLLSFFQDFVFIGHHQREGAILYYWMTHQNSSADHTIISRIENEHKELEELADKIYVNCQKHMIKDSSAESPTHILSDLTDFVSEYEEHIEKEEHFIFDIADALLLSTRDEGKMTEKLKKTYSNQLHSF